MSVDFEDWTRGVTVLTGASPVGADFPDWTVAIAVETGGGVIQEITSTGGTVTVTNPTGPIVNLEASGGGGLPNPLNFTGSGVTLNVQDSTPAIVSSFQMTGTTPGCEIDCQDLIIIKSEQSNLELRADNASVSVVGDTTGLGHIGLDASNVDIAPTFGSKIGFFNPAGGPVGKQTIIGSRGGNVALGNLLNALANLGIIANSTTP